jgi:nicotinamide riboside kinase
MKVFTVIGYTGSGKTTTIENIIKDLSDAVTAWERLRKYISRRSRWTSKVKILTATVSGCGYRNGARVSRTDVLSQRRYEYLRCAKALQSGHCNT